MPEAKVIRITTVPDNEQKRLLKAANKIGIYQLNAFIVMAATEKANKILRDGE